MAFRIMRDELSSSAMRIFMSGFLFKNLLCGRCELMRDVDGDPLTLALETREQRRQYHEITAAGGIFHAGTDLREEVCSRVHAGSLQGVRVVLDRHRVAI